MLKGINHLKTTRLWPAIFWATLLAACSNQVNATESPKNITTPILQEPLTQSADPNLQFTLTNMLPRSFILGNIAVPLPSIMDNSDRCSVMTNRTGEFMVDISGAPILQVEADVNNIIVEGSTIQLSALRECQDADSRGVDLSVYSPNVQEGNLHRMNIGLLPFVDFDQLKYGDGIDKYEPNYTLDNSQVGQINLETDLQLINETMKLIAGPRTGDMVKNVVFNNDQSGTFTAAVRGRDLLINYFYWNQMSNIEKLNVLVHEFQHSLLVNSSELYTREEYEQIFNLSSQIGNYIDRLLPNAQGQGGEAFYHPGDRTKAALEYNFPNRVLQEIKLNALINYSKNGDMNLASAMAVEDYLNRMEGYDIAKDFIINEVFNYVYMQVNAPHQASINTNSGEAIQIINSAYLNKLLNFDKRAVGDISPSNIYFNTDSRVMRIYQDELTAAQYEALAEINRRALLMVLNNEVSAVDNNPELYNDINAFYDIILKGRGINGSRDYITELRKMFANFPF